MRGQNPMKISYMVEPPPPLVTLAFLLEKVKTVDFSETIAACGLKVGRCRQLIEVMRVYRYSRSRSFLDLGARSCT